MQVTVHYLAQLKRAAGRGTESVDLPAGATLGELFHHLGERHGPAFRDLLLGPDGQPQRSLLLFVGDDPANAARPLRDGDSVTILAPMAGG